MTVMIYVPDIPEFAPVIDGARCAGNCRVIEPRQGYWQITADSAIQFQRKALGLAPALWYSMLSGGYRGRITEYGRDQLRIESDS